MDIMSFKEKIFEKAKLEGFSDFEIYYGKSESLEIGIYEGDIDNYNVNTTLGVSFRGIYNGKMGYSYTELIDEDSVNILVLSAKDSALSIDNEDEEFIYGEKEEYKSICGFNEELSKLPVEKKIEFALDLEKKASTMDPKVSSVAGCEVQEETIEYGIMNSKGINLTHKQNFLVTYVAPVVSDKDLKYDGFVFKVDNDLKNLNSENLAKEAVQEALSRIGGESVNSGEYKIVLRNDVMAMLLATFIGNFSAENVQKGLSLLKGKVGRKIASSKVTLVDDPHLEGGLYSTPFDAEGVATYKKDMIKEGTLNTLLYNLKAAAKDGVKSTGNAHKSSYASPVGISPTNCYIEKGEKSFEELIAYTKDGVFITDLAGLHSGANAVTGDFSLAAKGFVIENGKLGKPVEQITIAGNFFKLLEDIEEIANDLKATIPMGANYLSPSLLVKSLSVAGK